MLRATTEHAEHAQKASRESTEFPHLFNSKRSGHEGKADFVSQRAATPQDCQEGLPQRRQGKRGSFRPRQTDRASCEAFTLVGAKWEWPQPPSPPHRHCLSIAYLSGRCVTCHLQARRKACTTRAQPSLTASPPRSLHSPRSPLRSASEGALGPFSRTLCSPERQMDHLRKQDRPKKIDSG